mgnify:CR=1 FL=1
MTMQECYEAIGGNYEAILGRLHSEALIHRFVLKFLEYQSCIQLKQAFSSFTVKVLNKSAFKLKMKLFHYV